MKNALLISVDIGYGFVKCVAEFGGKKEKILFPSVIKERKIKKNIGGLFNSDDYVVDVEVDGRTVSYCVGDKAITDGAIRSHSDKGDFNDLEIKIFLLTATHILIRKFPTPIQYDRIDLCLGLPMSYMSKETVARLSSIVSCDLSKVTINDMTYAISFQEPNVYPQGIGAYYDAILDWNGEVRKPELAKASVAFIMIGYKTVELLALRFGRNGINIIEDLSDSLDLKGINLFLTEIQTLLSSNEKVDINTEFIERAILHEKNQLECNKGLIDITKYVEQAKEVYVKNITSEIKRKWGTSEDSLRYIYLAGASATMLFEHIKKEFKSIIQHGMDDPKETRLDATIYANANGYLKMRKAS